MKVKFLLCMVLSIAMIACSKDDDPLMDGGSGNTSSVVINADGSTSTGAVFSVLDDTSFFLDYIKYKVVDSHLEIVGYDPIEIAPDVRPYASVTLKGVTYNTRVIAQRAFYGCEKMRSISIPQSVTSIGIYAFYFCSNLTAIVIPDYIKVLNHFSGCKSLKNITIPNSVEYINGFDGCIGLTELIIPSSVKSIGSAAFSGCTGLKKITLPNSITAVYEYAFRDCSNIEEIILSNSIEEIQQCVFDNCTSLKKIIIPPSVNKIYMNSFIGCSSLTDLYYTGKAKLDWSIGSQQDYYGFYALSRNLTIHVTKEYYDKALYESRKYSNYNFNVVDDYPSNIIIDN